MRSRAWLCALGAIVLWALFATLVRRAGAAPPLLLTGLALCCGSLASVHRWRDWKVAPRVFAFGVASLFVYHACLVAAFRLAPIAQANLLNYLWPLLLVVLAACGPAGGGLRPWQVAGCALAFCGCALAIAPSAARAAPGAAHVAGYGLAILAATVWAVYSVAPRYLPPYSSWATGGFGLGAGLLALAAHALFEPAYRPSGPELAGIAAIGLGPLGLAFVLWDRALREGRASTIGSLSYLTPVLSTLSLAASGAIADGAGWRLAPALVLVLAGVRLCR